jgi:hypothetical protein
LPINSAGVNAIAAGGYLPSIAKRQILRRLQGILGSNS